MSLPVTAARRSSAARLPQPAPERVVVTRPATRTHGRHASPMAETRPPKRPRLHMTPAMSTNTLLSLAVLVAVLFTGLAVLFATGN
jgi:hypothetical protein